MLNSKPRTLGCATLPWKFLGTQDNTCYIVEIHRLAFLNAEAGLVPCESFRTRHESLNPIIAPTNQEHHGLGGCPMHSIDAATDNPTRQR
jgi:hypothetical protein